MNKKLKRPETDRNSFTETNTIKDMYPALNATKRKRSLSQTAPRNLGCLQNAKGINPFVKTVSSRLKVFMLFIEA